MNALVLTAPSTLELLERPTPHPGPDEILLRVRACGICGSDIHGWDGSSGRRNPPLIMGHEAAGEIAAVGSRVRTWNVGDRVTFDSTIYCGRCEYCRAGQVNLCDDRRVVGVSPAEYKQDGAFAEYLVLPERILHRIPAEMPFRRAAMVEPVSIAVHAVRQVSIASTDSTVVVGTGMIGLLVVQAFRWAGAKHIIAIDRETSRLVLAKQLGATTTIQSDSNEIPAAVQRLTRGRGADIVFEVVGAALTVQLGLSLLRKGGSMVLVGNLAQKIEFPLQQVVTREQKLYGSCGSAGEYPLCIDLIAQELIKVDPLLSAVAPLTEGAAWFQRLSSAEGGKYLKVILEP